MDGSGEISNGVEYAASSDKTKVKIMRTKYSYYICPIFSSTKHTKYYVVFT